MVCVQILDSVCVGEGGQESGWTLPMVCVQILDSVGAVETGLDASCDVCPGLGERRGRGRRLDASHGVCPGPG